MSACRTCCGAAGVNRSSRPSTRITRALAAAIGVKGLAVLAPAKDHKYAVSTVVVDEAGTMTPAQYKAMVADLVNFLDYMGEPTKNKRINLGIIVLLYLGLLFAFAYWMKREYWKDVH